MRIAIVADWLTTIGGAEQVIRELIHLYPHAHLFTTVARNPTLERFLGHPIRSTPLQYCYQILRTHQPLLPFFPQAIENIDCTTYDIILSSSHAVAKGIIPPSHASHISYCHTPMRYAWEMEEQYLHDFGVPSFLRPYLRRVLNKLRRWDMGTAKRVDTFIANSSTTAERIKRIYHRESVIVPPPVDERFFEVEIRKKSQEKSYFLAVGRLVPYKRLDLLIQTANKLHLPLKIVGQGREEKTLKAMAGPTVEFLGHIADDKLPSLYRCARALLFPALEDAGVVPLEAQACGTPVIAYGKGGTLDTVIDGQTGLFFPEQNTAALHDALARFETMSFDADIIRTHARKFSAQTFREKIGSIVQSSYETRAPIAQR